MPIENFNPLTSSADFPALAPARPGCVCALVMYGWPTLSLLQMKLIDRLALTPPLSLPGKGENSKHFPNGFSSQQVQQLHAQNCLVESAFKGCERMRHAFAFSKHTLK